MESIGRYEILQKIGAGGMAEVYLAKTTGAEGIEKRLVVKRVSPSLAQNKKFLTMFVDEAKVAMRLNHPNIVQVYAFERVGVDHILTMEHVDGLDLARLLTVLKKSAGRLPVAAAAYVAQESAKGLDYAHARRDDAGLPLEIVHRDVSPQNVLLSREGAVKVTDFGVAKARLSTDDAGVIKGKLSYMSPEQATGGSVDRRSDVWSLGVVLWEMICGRSLFTTRGPDDMEQVRTAPVPSPRDHVPDLPDALEQIVVRALARVPADRFSTAREMASALGRFLHELPEPFDAASLERIVARALGPDEQGPRPASPALPSRLDPAREIRERRSILAVSLNLRGWEDLRRTRGGPEHARAALASLARILGDIAYKNDAVLTPGDGAGFRVLLGLRHATVQDSLRAVRLALDAREALEGLSRDLPAPLAVGIGIARGEALVALGPKGELRRWEVAGNLLEIGAALASAARDGAILAGGGAYRMARRDFHFVEAGSVPTGADVSVRTYRLAGMKSPEERLRDLAQAAGVGGGLVGRALELHAIGEVIRDTLEKNRSGCTVILGETGIGKSALLAAALRSLPEGARVVRAECSFATEDHPFEGAAELVRDACDLPADPAAARERLERRVRMLFDDVGEDDRAAIAAVFESILGLRADAPPDRSGEDQEDADADAAERQRARLVAIRGLLERLARRGPLVVVIENIHWADGPSLRLFRDLSHRRYPAPIIGIVVGQPSPRLASLVEGLPRIHVGPLEDEDARRLVERRLGPIGSLGDLVDDVLETGAGNPLFLQEIVESLVERGVVEPGSADQPARLRAGSRAAVSLPTTLEGVLASRLDELTPGARRVLRWAAVAGHSVPEAVLAGLVGPEGALDRAELFDRGLLAQSGDSIRFASSAVRQVAYRALDPEDRRRMHRAVGERLLSHPGRRVRPARIARHLELGGDRAGAARHYLDAAEAARALYSNREAMRLYEKALALLPEDAAEAFSAHEHAEQVLRGAGRVVAREKAVVAMRRIADASRDPAKIALAWNRLARLHVDRGNVAAARRALSSAFASARTAKDKGAAVEALRLLASVHREEGRYAEGLRCCDHALAILGAGRRDLVQRGTVLIQKGVLLRQTGRIAESLDAYAEAVVLYQRLSIKRLEAHALSNMSVAAAAHGDVDDAVLLLRRAMAIDRETGDRFHLGNKMRNLGEALLDAGDRKMGRSLVEKSIDLHERLHNRLGLAEALVTLAEADVEDGALDAAEERLARAEVLYGEAGAEAPVYDEARLRTVAARAAFARGRLDQVVLHARRAMSLAETSGIAPLDAPARALLAEALAASGLREEALTEAMAALQSLENRRGVARGETVAFACERAARTLGDAALADRAHRIGEGEIDRRRSRIRSARLRECFAGGRTLDAR